MNYFTWYMSREISSSVVPSNDWPCSSRSDESASCLLFGRVHSKKPRLVSVDDWASLSWQGLVGIDSVIVHIRHGLCCSVLKSHFSSHILTLVSSIREESTGHCSMTSFVDWRRVARSSLQASSSIKHVEAIFWVSLCIVEYHCELFCLEGLSE